MNCSPSAPTSVFMRQRHCIESAALISRLPLLEFHYKYPGANMPAVLACPLPVAPRKAARDAVNGIGVEYVSIAMSRTLFQLGPI